MTTPSDPYGDPPPAQGWGPPPAQLAWQQQGYGPSPQGWGPPVQPYGAPPQTETKAVVALVLAIGSFVVLPVVAAVAALVVASGARRDIDASGGRLTGAGLVTAARVISWINLGLAMATVVLLVLAVVLFAAVG
ncbi:MAG: putative rane protein [Frankiales bacterium]|nr:putative rane protein [Frankiales bacterium]